MQDVNIDELARTAKMLALSGYFDAKGDSAMAVAQIATKILAGRELGYGPFASVNGIHIIQGKPAISANLMAAAVKAHPAYDYRVRTNTDKIVSIEFFQGDESLGMSEFTIEQAQAANLKSPTWKAYPRNMLFARAMSNGVRWYVPDVFSGNAVYVPDELDGDETEYTVLPPSDDDMPPQDDPDPVAAPPDAADTPDATETPDPPQDTNDNENGQHEPNPLGWLHAEVGKTVPPDETERFRHYAVYLYTAQQTPDNVRSSSAELSDDERLQIVNSLHSNRKWWQKRWQSVKEETVTA
jgi:hypothetical protein